MNRRFLVFGLLIVAQIAVPFRMIQQREAVLREGELFRFKTQPIDPADPFQGRYVWLRIEKNYIQLSEQVADTIDYNDRGYAVLNTDGQGFARFTEWSFEKPTDTQNFLKTKALGKSVRWEDASESNNGERLCIYQGLRIDIPFTRFYMDEAKAPRAEIRAREASQNEDCWVEVRILNGQAVIEDVIAEGQSLRDLAAETN